MSLRIYGHRPLQSLPGPSTRPTSSRVREALFNILQGQIPGSRWLDLCAGVGTIGAEVLCRGARSVVGIERSGQACRVIAINWSKVADTERFHVIRGDARGILSRPVQMEPFDFVYFDPPYASELYGIVLPLVADWLVPEGILIVEHDPGQDLPQETIGLIRDDARAYGKTRLTFYRQRSSGRF